MCMFTPCDSWSHSSHLCAPIAVREKIEQRSILECSASESDSGASVQRKKKQMQWVNGSNQMHHSNCDKSSGSLVTRHHQLDVLMISACTHWNSTFIIDLQTNPKESTLPQLLEQSNLVGADCFNSSKSLPQATMLVSKAHPLNTAEKFLVRGPLKGHLINTFIKIVQLQGGCQTSLAASDYLAVQCRANFLSAMMNKKWQNVCLMNSLE